MADPEPNGAEAADCGYYQMTATFDGATCLLWQRVESGVVTGYVKADGTPIELPDVYEMAVLDATLRQSPQAGGGM